MAGDRETLLKQCCCGCTLKVGAMIIGVLYLLGSLMELGNAWYRATHPNNQIHASFNFEENLNSLSEDKLDSQIVFQVDDPYGKYFVAQAVFAGIQAVAAVLLLVGTGQERSGLVLPWLVVEAIVMVVHGILFILLAVISFTSQAAVAGAVFLVCLLIYAALSIYFYLVIYSFYQSLNLRNNVRMV